MMRSNLKIWMAGVLISMSILTLSAGMTAKTQAPEIADEDKILQAPGRFYYCGNDSYLHCYDTNEGTDTKFDNLYIHAPFAFILDNWYDSSSDCVYLIQLDRGTQCGTLTVNKIDSDQNVTPLISLDGPHSDLIWEVTDDYVYLQGTVAEYNPINIPDIEGNQAFSGFFSKDMKPWKFSLQSMETLKIPELNFYSVTTPGVNVIDCLNENTPRLGYYTPLPGNTDGELTAEKDDIDTEIFKCSFTPWQPEVGYIFASRKIFEHSDGWIRMIWNNPLICPAISSKYVRLIDYTPLVSNTQISGKRLTDKVSKINSAKYPGLWLMKMVDDYCNEAWLLIGTEIDGVVVFKWIAYMPDFDPMKKIRLQYDNTNNMDIYGKELTNDEDELDFSKITDDDLDKIFKTVEYPLRENIIIMMDIPGQGIKMTVVPSL